MNKEIVKILNTLGVPMHFKGYRYLINAIEMLQENDDLKMTKELYVDIASKYKDTPARVERAIRYAIEFAWTKGNIEYALVDKIFGNSIDVRKNKPTNMQFCKSIANYLLYNFENDKEVILNHKENDVKATKLSNKVIEATEFILYNLATNIEFYKIFKKYIKAEEFIKESYVKFAKLIFEYNENETPINLFHFLEEFKNPEEREEILRILQLNYNYKNLEALEKVINDQIKLIKKAYFDKVVLESTNIDEVQSVLKEKKLFDKLYITLS